MRLRFVLALLLAGCSTPVTPASTVASVATVPVGVSPHGAAAALGFVYTGSIDGSRIDAIDTRTNAVAKTLPLDQGSVVFLVAFPDGQHMLALDNKRGEVLVIDPAQDHKVLQTIAVGRGPDEAQFAADGSAIVALADEDAVVRLRFDATDLTKPPEKTPFAVGTAAGATNRHRPLGQGPGWAVVPNTGDNDVSIVDFTGAGTRRVNDGNNPGPVAIGTWDGKAQVALVGYRASHSVAFYDLAGGPAVKVLDQGLFPQSILLDGQRAYVIMSGSDELLALDLATKAPIGRVKIGSRPVEGHVWPSATGAGREVWVGNDGGDSVTVVDADTLAVKATLAAGAGHHHLARWENKVYATNLASGTVTVIDRTKL